MSGTRECPWGRLELSREVCAGHVPAGARVVLETAWPPADTARLRRDAGADGERMPGGRSGEAAKEAEAGASPAAAVAPARRRRRPDGVPLRAADLLVPRDARPAGGASRRGRNATGGAGPSDGPSRAGDEPRRAGPGREANRLRAARRAPVHRQGNGRLEPPSHGT